MGVTESQGVLKVFLSWERGARVNFNEPPGCVWHELVCGGAGERWGSWERLLISEERGVVGGRAVVVVADGLCGGQREREDCGGSPRGRLLRKGWWQRKGKAGLGWPWGLLCRSERGSEAHHGSRWLRWDSLEMATVTGVWSGVSALVSRAVGRQPIQCSVLRRRARALKSSGR